MAAIVINPPTARGVQPSDNRLVFEVGADDGAVIEIVGEEDNIIGLRLENEISDTWDAVPAIGGNPYPTVFLPNISTEVLTQILLANGVNPVPPLPQGIDKYTVQNGSITFSGNDATFTAELVNIEDSNLAWDITLEFENKANWSTWSGLGNIAARRPDYKPRNVLIYQGAPITESLIEQFIGEPVENFAITFLGNLEFMVVFDNMDYDFQPNELFKFQMREFYSIASLTTTMSGATGLRKLYFYNSITVTGAITYLIGNNPALEELYVFPTSVSAITPPTFTCPNLRTMWVLGIDISAIAGDAWDDLPLSLLQVYARSDNETNNGGNPSAVLQSVTAAGGQVDYDEGERHIPFNNNTQPSTDGEYWTINEATSSLDGASGSLFEGISLNIGAPSDNKPGLQVDPRFGSFQFRRLTPRTPFLYMGASFKITGSTSGSVFAGSSDYYIKTTVFVNGQLHSVHRVFTTAGTLQGFDVSPITSSVVDKTVLPQQAVVSANNQAFINVLAVPVIEGVEIGTPLLSAAIDVWKARVDERRLATWNWAEWAFKPQNNTGRFLTDYPRDEVRRIRRGDNYYIGAMYSRFVISNATKKLRGRWMLEGTDVGERVHEVEDIVEGTSSQRAGILAINLLESLWVNGTTLTQANADSADEIVFESIRELPASTPASTDKVRLKIWDGECDLGRTVHFLNRLGAMESYYFDRQMDESAEVTGYKADKRSNAGYDLAEDGLSEYLREANDRLTLRTDWLPESVHNWLVKEITESPYILTVIDGVYVRMWVRETRWEKETHQKNSIMRAEIDFEISETRYSPVI